MATDKQIDFIEAVMQQNGISRSDLKEEWRDYERLSTREVDSLLRWLKGDGERTTIEASDSHVWAVIKAVLAERDQLRAKTEAAENGYAVAQADKLRLTAALKWLAHDYALHSFDQAVAAVRWLEGNADDEKLGLVYSALRDKTDELRAAREVPA